MAPESSSSSSADTPVTGDVFLRDRGDLSIQEQSPEQPVAKGWRGFAEDAPPPKPKDLIVHTSRNGDIIITGIPAASSTVQTDADGNVIVRAA
jgi:hypothetical protein